MYSFEQRGIESSEFHRINVTLTLANVIRRAIFLFSLVISINRLQSCSKERLNFNFIYIQRAK